VLEVTRGTEETEGRHQQQQQQLHMDEMLLSIPNYVIREVAIL
jgi:hypothetical protein